MAALLPPPTKPLPRRSRAPLGSLVLAYLRTTDHKQIGKLYLVTTFAFPDVAFPRLNAFSYWLFLFGGLIVLTGFLTPGGAADFGWFAYTPLSNAINSPSVGGDLWTMGLVVSGLGTILAAVNMVTTIVCLRARPVR